jgi:hypothetical protein
MPENVSKRRILASRVFIVVYKLCSRNCHVTFNVIGQEIGYKASKYLSAQQNACIIPDNAMMAL